MHKIKFLSTDICVFDILDKEDSWGINNIEKWESVRSLFITCILSYISCGNLSDTDTLNNSVKLWRNDGFALKKDKSHFFIVKKSRPIPRER